MHNYYLIKDLTSCAFGVEYQMHFVWLKIQWNINLAMSILTKYQFLTTMKKEKCMSVQLFSVLPTINKFWKANQTVLSQF